MNPNSKTLAYSGSAKTRKINKNNHDNPKQSVNNSNTFHVLMQDEENDIERENKHDEAEDQDQDEDQDDGKIRGLGFKSLLGGISWADECGA